MGARFARIGEFRRKIQPQRELTLSFPLQSPTPSELVEGRPPSTPRETIKRVSCPWSKGLCNESSRKLTLPSMSAADYRTLGVSPSAGLDAARASFRKLALRLHPDKNPSPDANEKYLAVAKAYEAILRSGDRAAEADALLADPFSDIFGDGWARALAEGSANPSVMLERGRERAAAELGDAAEAPLADFAADLGLDGATLAALVAAANLGDGEGDDAAAGNPFKEFFDSLPAAERPRMLELFEKTFPAFLAQEMADTQLEAENELFRLAVESHALPAQRRRQSAAPIRAISEEIVQDVEGLNAEAVTHFGLGEYAAAAAALSRAIALDPALPSLYGNRSLAHERCGQAEEALEDAERAIRCDPIYVPAYERKARALLLLRRSAEALAAVRRGLLLDPEHEALLELEEQAEREADAARLDIMRAGKDQIEWGDNHGSPGGLASLCVNQSID